MPAEVIDYRFRMRRGPAANWTSKNDVLLAGEWGIETDTGKAKIGDGVTAWNSLPYTLIVLTKGQITARKTAGTGLAEPCSLSEVLDFVDAGVANGDLLYRSGGVWTRLPIGPGGQVLTVAGGLPSWQPSGGGGGGVDLTTLPYMAQPLATRGAWGFYSIAPNTVTSQLQGVNTGILNTMGTGSLQAVSFTNAFTRQPRLKYTSSATAGSLAGVWSDTNLSSGDGGYFFSWRGGVEDAAAVANGFWFVGLRNSTVAPTNTNPSNVVNCIGFGADTGDANMQFMHNDGSGTCTKHDLGANFPANSIATDFYEFQILTTPGSNLVQYHIRNTRNSATASGSVTTDIPSGSTSMGVCYFRGNGSTALAVRLSLTGWTIGYNLEGM